MALTGCESHSIARSMVNAYQWGRLGLYWKTNTRVIDRTRLRDSSGPQRAGARLQTLHLRQGGTVQPLRALRAHSGSEAVLGKLLGAPSTRHNTQNTNCRGSVDVSMLPSWQPQPSPGRRAGLSETASHTFQLHLCVNSSQHVLGTGPTISACLTPGT